MPIEDSISNKLPSTVKLAFLKAQPEQQQVFVSEYKKKSWNPLLCFIMAIFLVHLFYMRKILLGVLFVFTFGGFGIWYLAELVYVWFRVKNHNEEVSAEIMRDIKIMDMGAGNPINITVSNN